MMNLAVFAFNQYKNPGVLKDATSTAPGPRR